MPDTTAIDRHFQSHPTGSSVLRQPEAHPTLTAVNQENLSSASEVTQGPCAGKTVCPLSRVPAGTLVCVRELAVTPEVSDRLREMGFGVDQHVKLLSTQDSVICLVCNARVALSGELADSILVEEVCAPR